MRRDRVTISLIMAMILIIAVGFARPEVPGVPPGMQERILSETKTTWTARFDMALAGDSRISYGLSPEKMNEILPGYRIANFGFPVCGYEKNYLDSIEKLLDPDSGKKTIVLGVSPRSLTPVASKENGFLEQKRSDPFSKLIFKILPSPSTFLLAYTPVEIKMLVERKPPPITYYHEVKTDGWITSSQPAISADEPVSPYARRPFENNSVSPEITASLAARIKEWTSRGIAVYAFRPPAPPGMIALENDFGGFNEEKVSRQLRAAGARWLEFTPEDYQTFDGSHITKESAIKLSKNLAEEILKNTSK